jgi:hypothetical protein
VARREALFHFRRIFNAKTPRGNAASRNQTPFEQEATEETEGVDD